MGEGVTHLADAHLQELHPGHRYFRDFGREGRTDVEQLGEGYERVHNYKAYVVTVFCGR